MLFGICSYLKGMQNELAEYGYSIQYEKMTELEKERYDGALRRKQISLILAGKLPSQQATELKALFE